MYQLALLLSLPVVFTLYRFLCAKKINPARPQQTEQVPQTALMAKFKRISPPSRRPKLSISTNGVLFDLRLNLLPDGLAFLKRVVSLNHFEIYLITRVASQQDQAKVLDQLSSSSVITNKPGSQQVLGRRVLFCSSVEGNEAMVRSLSATLHIEPDGTIAASLHKYIPHAAVLLQNEVFLNDKESLAGLCQAMPSHISLSKNYDQIWKQVALRGPKS